MTALRDRLRAEAALLQLLRGEAEPGFQMKISCRDGAFIVKRISWPSGASEPLHHRVGRGSSFAEAWAAAGGVRHAIAQLVDHQELGESRP